METPTRITSFRGPHAFLSNFYPAQVWYEKQSYRNVEVAFQAAKTLHPRERAWLREAKSPGEARERGQQVTLRDDWDDVRVDVMRQLLRQKFTHHCSSRHSSSPPGTPSSLPPASMGTASGEWATITAATCSDIYSWRSAWSYNKS